MKVLVRRLRNLRDRRDKGASAVEYGLLVALIAVVIAAAVFALGNTLNDRFGSTNQCVQDPTSENCDPPGGAG